MIQASEMTNQKLLSDTFAEFHYLNKSFNWSVSHSRSNINFEKISKLMKTLGRHRNKNSLKMRVCSGIKTFVLFYKQINLKRLYEPDLPNLAAVAKDFKGLVWSCASVCGSKIKLSSSISCPLNPNSTDRERC